MVIEMGLPPTSVISFQGGCIAGVRTIKTGGQRFGKWYCEVVQQQKGVWLYQRRERSGHFRALLVNYDGRLQNP